MSLWEPCQKFSYILQTDASLSFVDSDLTRHYHFVLKYINRRSVLNLINLLISLNSLVILVTKSLASRKGKRVPDLVVIEST